MTIVNIYFYFFWENIKPLFLWKSIKSFCFFSNYKKFFFFFWMLSAVYETGTFRINLPAIVYRLKGLDTFFHHLPHFLFAFLNTKPLLKTFTTLPVCFSEHQTPSEKGSTLKGKNLLPRAANSFLLEWTYFKKRAKQFWKSCLPWKHIHSS